MLLTPFYLYADRSESQYDAKTRENVDDKYGIPFVPAERNDNKRAFDAHLMISAT
jgi:hypothetical protein